MNFLLITTICFWAAIIGGIFTLAAVLLDDYLKNRGRKAQLKILTDLAMKVEKVLTHLDMSMSKRKEKLDDTGSPNNEIENNIPGENKDSLELKNDKNFLSIQKKKN